MEIKILYTFLIAFVIIFVIDFLWLGLLAKNFYKQELKSLSKEKFNLFSALIVYVFLALGITIFVISCNFSDNLLMAFLFGVLFGIIVYGIYDFTNYAIIKDWSIKLTLIDVMWGGFLCGVVSLITKYLVSLIK